MKYILNAFSSFFIIIVIGACYRIVSEYFGFPAPNRILWLRITYYFSMAVIFIMLNLALGKVSKNKAKPIRFSLKVLLGSFVVAILTALVGQKISLAIREQKMNDLRSYLACGKSNCDEDEPHSSQTDDQAYLEKGRQMIQAITKSGLCGSFVNKDGGMIEKLNFVQDNNVDVEGMVTYRWKYLFDDNKVLILSDKAILELQIVKDKLIGVDHWLKGNEFQKQDDANDCHTKAFTQETIMELAGDICYAEAVKLHKPTKIRRAEKKYLQCCNMGNSRSCNSYGIILNGLKQDPEAANTYFTKSCTMGYAIACVNLADQQTYQGNHEKAMALHKQACKKGHQVSCMRSEPEGYELMLPDSAPQMNE